MVWHLLMILKAQNVQPLHLSSAAFGKNLRHHIITMKIWEYFLELFLNLIEVSFSGITHIYQFELEKFGQISQPLYKPEMRPQMFLSLDIVKELIKKM